MEEDAPPEQPPDDGTAALPDDLLRLVFTCCHPALSQEAQVALTLRLVCGLTTAEAAAACLVSSQAMSARITRAKHKLTASGAPYRVPRPSEWPERLEAVLAVAHLVVTVGHTAPSGDSLLRSDLLARGLHLARTLAELLPDEPEVTGLLALCLLHVGRRDARTDEAWRPCCWRTRTTVAGTSRSSTRGTTRPCGRSAGRLALQASLASAHLRRLTPDWEQVVQLRARLLAVWDNPVVALDAAAALGLPVGRRQVWPRSIASPLTRSCSAATTWPQREQSCWCWQGTSLPPTPSTRVRRRG